VGLPIPRVVITAEDILTGKPLPDCYLLGASCMGVDPADTIVLEDAEARGARLLNLAWPDFPAGIIAE
jgi:beta-phosphoglucomutase-like phosphatase (HAD superfamily)